MNQIKINEVVYTYKSLPAFFCKGTKLTPEKIKHYRETYPELKDAAMDTIGRKHIELIKEKLLVEGPGLERRKILAGYYR